MNPVTYPAGISKIISSLPFRLAAINFLVNLSMESSGVFIPLYAKGFGASNIQVGIIGAAWGFSFFLSNILFGRQLDIRGRVPFIRWGLAAMVFAYLTQILATNTVTLILSRASIGFCMGLTTAAIMAYTYDYQNQVGKVASYGALGWVIAAIIAAIIKNYHALFIISSVAVFFAAFLTMKFREAPTTARLKIPVFPIALIKSDRKIYLPFFLRQNAIMSIFSVLSLYMASMGASKTWIASFDIINNGVQFIAMRFVEKFNPVKAFRFGLLVSVIVFASYGFIRNYLEFIPAFALLAIAWSCVLVGALAYLLRKHTERGTVSSQLYSVMFLSGSTGPFIGGAVSQAWGYPPLMFFGAGLSLVAYFISHGVGTVKKPVPAAAPAKTS